jgi:hypothetical protein
MAGDIVTKAPKTMAGRRTIAIPPNVVPVLEDHLERFVGTGPDSLVAVGEKGGPLFSLRRGPGHAMRWGGRNYGSTT